MPDAVPDRDPADRSSHADGHPETWGASVPAQPPTGHSIRSQGGRQSAFCQVAVANRTGLRSRECRFEILLKTLVRGINSNNIPETYRKKAGRDLRKRRHDQLPMSGRRPGSGTPRRESASQPTGGDDGSKAVAPTLPKG